MKACRTRPKIEPNKAGNRKAVLNGGWIGLLVKTVVPFVISARVSSRLNEELS